LDYENNETLYNPGVNIFSSSVYNKGAWVLHMLRKEIGDSIFFEGLDTYYNKFKYSNASSEDLKSVFEMVSKRNLDQFFEQWVYVGTGIIELEIDWNEKIISENNIQLKITIEQKQKGYQNYHFPLDIELVDSLGTISNYTPYIITDTTLIYNLENRIEDVFIDKGNWLLAIIE